MRNTKEVILITALDLFNKHGLSKITLRSIAQKMGISQGNLNYHFKKREDIIEALYYRLVEQIDQSMQGIEQTDNALQMMFDISSRVMYSFFAYRFILLDFSQIMHDHKRIKKHYRALSIEREQQFQLLLSVLQKQGLIRKEILPDEFKNLYTRITIIGDFWISSATIRSKSLGKKMVKEYAVILQQAFYPYLTKKGCQEYHKIVD